MILLLDIGNTRTHVGLATPKRIVRHTSFPTARGAHAARRFRKQLIGWVDGDKVEGACLASVVPRATAPCLRCIRSVWRVDGMVLDHRTLVGLALDYPKPDTLGADRLANALAACHHYGAPCVVVDFGTAVTFDVVDRRGRFIGGVIAAGLQSASEYLHDKTALLPRITPQDTVAALGKSTKEAMQIGVVHGFCGLVRELLGRIRRHLKTNRLPVIATGGDAAFMARRLPELTAVDPQLTLHGLRLAWLGAKGRSVGTLRKPRK